MRLKEYGSELIEVADNGTGVSPENYAALTKKYHTSKISNFQDVAGVSTFGFRGEALSSVCVVSVLSVTTRTADQTVGVKLSFDHEGAITGMLYHWYHSTALSLVSQYRSITGITGTALSLVSQYCSITGIPGIGIIDTGITVIRSQVPLSCI